MWAGGWTNPYDGTRQRKCSTSDFNDVVRFIRCVHSCVFRSYRSSSANRWAIQKRLKLLSTVGELAGTYREASQDFRGLYLQLAYTMSSQLHTVADVQRHLIPRCVTAVPWPTTLQITLWIKRKSLSGLHISELKIHNILAIGDYNTVTRWRGRSTVRDL